MIERDPVSADSDHRHATGTKPTHLPDQSLPSRPQYVRGELGRRRRSPGDQVRNPDSFRKQQLFFPRLQQAVCEAGGMQRWPEAVAGPGKMVAGGSRVETGIDTAEQHAEAGCEQVGDLATRSRKELRSGRPVVSETAA